MLHNLNKRKQEGFTIIEVMIVLAIAGLIILIVLLAVPALQRNSRNTQRKNDVSSVVGAIQEYSNNHNGQLPTKYSDFSANTKLGFYTGASDVKFTVNATPFSTDPTTDADKAIVNAYTYAKCKSDGSGLDTTGQSARNVAAVYFIEQGSGGLAEQCQDM